MPHLEVFFSPALYPYSDFDSDRITVVVDIYRATTAICAALYSGAETVIPCSDLEQAKVLKKPSFFIAAEREGVQLPFADFGNSAYEFYSMNLKGKNLIYSTTNGTMALEMAQKAGRVVAGGFCNFSRLTDYLNRNEKNVFILCSGWKKAFSLEDSLFAGALAKKLIETGNYHVNDDACIAALALNEDADSNVYSYLQNASHFKRLEKLGALNDLEFCIQTDTCPVVPVMIEGVMKGVDTD